MGNIITVVSVIVLSLIFLYTPYLRGLFFDSDMYLIEVIIASLFVIFVISQMVKKTEKSPLSYTAVFLIPLTYLVSLINAESPQGTLDNIFRWVSYVSTFIILVWAKQSIEPKRLEQVYAYVFQLTGIWVSFFAVIGLWGWVEFKDLMLGDRLTGTFQYANTYAAVLCAFWLYTLMMLTRNKMKVGSVILFSLPLVAYGVGLFHSYSRGALLVFPIAWLVGLFLLKGRQQIAFVMYSVISGAASFIVFREISTQREQQLSNPGVFSFFIASLLVIASIYVVRFLFNKYASENFFSNKGSRYILPGLAIAFGVLLLLDFKYGGLVYQQLPSSFQERISDINTETASLLGRTNVYEDAIKMTKDSPIIGYGGEGWKILYPRYQELPYLNNEVHNGYLEILVSTGWLGLVAFAFVLVFLLQRVVTRMWREDTQDGQIIVMATLPALAMLLLHSGIDFNFSYGTVLFMVFWLLAIGVPVVNVSNSKRMNKIFSSPTVSRIVLSTSALFVLIGGIYAFRFYLSESAFDSTVGEIPIEEAQTLLERAVSLNPYSTDKQINLGNLYATRFRTQGNEEWKNKAVERFNMAESLEPRNAKVMFAIGNGYAALNDWEKIVQYYELAMKHDPFNVEYVDSAIQFEAQFAVQFAHLGVKDKMLMLAQNTKSIYENYMESIKTFTLKMVPDKRPLDLALTTRFHLGQTFTILGEYQQALDVLKPITDPKFGVDVGALSVVIYEALGLKGEASAITKNMVEQQYNDFPQKVVKYRILLDTH